MNTDEFLDTVVTTEEGLLCLCFRNHSIEWQQEFHSWPHDKGKILDRIAFLHDNYDVYFSSHLFSEPDASKEHVLQSNTIQADIDNGDIDGFSLQPTVLVETSPGRHQGYWVISKDVTMELPSLESLSKKVTYNIGNSDHSGWSLGHRLRVPGTLNFKYNNGPHTVSIVTDSGPTYLPESIELLPNIAPALPVIFESTITTEQEMGPFELLSSLKDKIPGSVYAEYIAKTVSPDRSSALWRLMCALFEAGLDRNQVFWLAKHSPNNKFHAELRYNADRDLINTVKNAEKHVKVKPMDVKGIVDNARSQKTPDMPGGALFKRRHVMSLLETGMKYTGRFVKAQASLPYFIPNDTGRPIALTHGSEHFRALLNLRYGFNAADPEWKYVHAGIIDIGVSQEDNVMEGSMSFYDSPTNTMYFHPGRREVLRITSDNISVTQNGEHGVIFPWYEMFEPFTPDTHSDIDWGDYIFGDIHNVVNMTSIQAKAILKTWFIFSLFKSTLSSRPILAFFGPPSSGKSTIPHKIYATLYARRLAVQGVSGPNEFDSSSAKLHIYCIDNLDTYYAWIMDKLALAIGDSDLLKRKLYTDVDMVRMRRQAMLCVTAYNPKFTREDVTSRLLLIQLDEITDNAMKNETDMIQAIITNRAKIWGSILRDVQRVLKTERGPGTVKWRIQDFSDMGEWIATALGFQQDFIDGLRHVRGAQSDTLLKQDEVLVQTLLDLANGPPQDFLSATQLYNELLIVSTNQDQFKKVYKNHVRLAHKMQVLKSHLSSLVSIESEIDPLTKAMRWRIGPL